MAAGNSDKAMLAAIRAMVGQLEDGAMRRALEDALDGRTAEARAEQPVRKLVVSGNEAAMMLGVTRRTVQLWAKKGLIRRAKWNGNKRGFGYALDSVSAGATDGRPA